MKRTKIPDESVAAFESLTEEIRARPETPDSGYYSRNQWAEIGGVDQSTAGERIAAGIKSGKVTVKEYRVLIGGRLQRLKHYKIEASKETK